MRDAPVLTLEGVTKQYGAVRAVDDLSFTVRPGAVTGFLGPNGSGKTTTLRMLLGLAEPTGGRALVADRPYAAHERPARLVGAAVDPGFHPGRTGLGHLEAYAPQVGVDRARCRTVLELVGLGSYADGRVGAYSMGMRQRLGLATALLADPPAIVLDEPANGLDPEGIVWLRGLLRTFAAEGRTVLVSSHVLGEVQHTVDDVVIIARGRLVHASSLAELEAEADRGTYVVAADRAGLERLAGERGWGVEPSAQGLLVRGPDAAEVGAACFAAGLELHQLATRTEDLEQAFFRLTGHPASEGAA